MKLKSATVIALSLLLCGFVSAQTFGFVSVGGGLFCNYEQLVNGGEGIYTGTDNLSVCGSSFNSSILGFGDKSDPGLLVHGAGVAYGDDIFALQGNPEEQYEVFSKLKCNTKNKNGHYTGGYGWIGVAAFSGYVAGTNDGYLSCTIPSANDDDAIMRGTTVDQMPRHR